MLGLGAREFDADKLRAALAQPIEIGRAGSQAKLLAGRLTQRLWIFSYATGLCRRGGWSLPEPAGDAWGRCGWLAMICSATVRNLRRSG